MRSGERKRKREREKERERERKRERGFHKSEENQKSWNANFEVNNST